MKNHECLRTVRFHIILALLAACGIGCDSGSGASSSARTADDLTSARVEKSVTYTLMAMNEDASDAEIMEVAGDMAQSLDVMERFPLKKPRDVLDDVFNCGELKLENGMIEYSFDENEECPELSGSIQMNLGPENSDGNMEISFLALSNGECTVEGHVAVDLAREDGVVQAVLTSDDLSICGREFNGTTTITMERTENGYVLDMDRSRIYQSDEIIATVSSNFVHDPENGVNGSAEVEINGETYTLIAAGIRIDRACGLPNAGTLTISGPDGDTADIDFSRTSCENEIVTFIWNGLEKTIDLEEAAEHYRNNRPFNIRQFLTTVE